ncbi:hypothetical protein VNI00_015804 [Paramarasmius palmivorus]|uniref:ferric-chelate reductase (NADPH) n=1 Tax=Paramarasmius palmivorus TaxID=297713 RepID=A0AAW0BJ93_9AGAR
MSTNTSATESHSAHDHGSSPEMAADPYEESPKYAKGVLYFLCGTLALFIIGRWIVAIRNQRRFSQSALKSGIYRKGIAISRYLSSKQQRIFGVHFPVLGSGLLILAFFVFLMAWAFSVHPYYWSSWDVQSPPLAIRTGLMTIGMYPFILILASKWNFVTLLTGHSYEKLQVFHQFLGHIFFLFGMFHSFPYVVQGMSEVKPGWEPMTKIEYSIFVTKKVYYWSGFAMLGFLVILCWLSLSPIRNRYYETFKIIHHLCSLTFLGLFFVHCNSKLDSNDWLWSTVVVYSLSVAFRFAWMLISNSGGTPKASFELMPAGMVKLRIKCNPNEKWGPGQHYFLNFKSVLPLQSHPFTIANLPSPEKNELVVLIRQAHGVTKALAQHLEGKDPNTTVLVFIDGPFGGIGQDLSIYEHALLIAGGTGVTFIMPVLQDLLAKTRQKDCVCRSIQVLWSVREEDSISWMIAELENAVKEAPSSALTVKIHVTGAAASKNDDDSEKEKVPQAGAALSYPWYGRADVRAVVSAAAADSRTLGVAACGPETLLYDVRNAVADVEKDIVFGKAKCTERSTPGNDSADYDFSSIYINPVLSIVGTRATGQSPIEKLWFKLDTVDPFADDMLRAA